MIGIFISRNAPHLIADAGRWEESVEKPPIGRWQADVLPVSDDDGLGLRGILPPAAPADARDARPANDPAAGPPGQPYRRGRWRQSDAARRSSTATRPRSSA